MEKEFGKWLMDIAKYMVTALLLSTIFSDMQDIVIVYIVAFISIAILVMGLYLVDNSQNPRNRNSRKKK